MELVDPSLHDEPRLSEILRCIQIALLCVQDSWERPTMSDTHDAQMREYDLTSP